VLPHYRSRYEHSSGGAGGRLSQPGLTRWLRANRLGASHFSSDAFFEPSSVPNGIAVGQPPLPRPCILHVMRGSLCEYRREEVNDCCFPIAWTRAAARDRRRVAASASSRLWLKVGRLIDDRFEQLDRGLYVFRRYAGEKRYIPCEDQISARTGSTDIEPSIVPAIDNREPAIERRNRLKSLSAVATLALPEERASYPTQMFVS
jgi:hypothetical protein